MRLPTRLALACVLSGVALTQARAELKATQTAIACIKPENLQAAEEAHADRLKMDRLGCFAVMADTPAKRIDDSKAGAVWRVLLAPGTTDAMEVWARPSSFQE